MMEHRRLTTKKKVLGHVESDPQGKTINITDQKESNDKKNLSTKKLCKTLKSVSRTTKSHPKTERKLQLKTSKTSLITQSASLIVNHNKAALLLRAAIIEGGACTDPKRNLGLSIATKRARELGLTKSTQLQIIRKCRFVCEGRPIAILQIRYQRKAFIICTVHTRRKEEFEQDLMPLLKKHFAGIAHVLHMFRSHTFIEAIVPYDIGGDFENLDHNVRAHALACGAINSQLQDYETGTYRFRVDPLILQDVSQALKTKGYRVTNVEYNFQPKTLVNLNHHEREAYDNFLWKLRQIPEIDGMFDNVRNSAASRAA